MSKAKRAKSGNSSDTGNWETELVQAAFFEVIFLLILVIFCIQYGLYINRVSVSDLRFATRFRIFTNHFFKKNKENHKSKFADLLIRKLHFFLSLTLVCRINQTNLFSSCDAIPFRKQ